MKKFLAVLLALSLLMGCAFAQETASEANESTQLPLGAAFGMTLEAVSALCPACEVQTFEEDVECGTVYAECISIGIGSINADTLFFEVNRENSALAPRLYAITAYLPVSSNSIADFRAALADLTAAYGEPESDPFDESAVESYVEYGGLCASWTTADCRIALSMYRSSYGDSVYIYFTSTQNYDAADLAE